MKIGDLVRYISSHIEGFPLDFGIIIGCEDAQPIVFWNEDFQSELEYWDQLELVQDAGG